jgi:hypothetical protein
MSTAIRLPQLTLPLAAFLVCSFAQGAIIGFTQKGWVPGDLSMNGSLVMAVNLGTTRTVDVFSGSGIGAPAIANVDYSSRGDDRVLLVTGTFIADRSTQSLFIRGMQPATDYAGWLNAMQLRDLGVAPSPVVFNVPGLSWPDKYLVQTLQGLVNRQGPRLMLGDSGTYADQYVQDYTWNAEWRTAYQQELGMQFQTISGLANLVQFFRSDFNGLVVYDSAIDGTRCVAMTGDTLRILRELPFTTTK